MVVLGVDVQDEDGVDEVVPDCVTDVVALLCLTSLEVATVDELLPTGAVVDNDEVAAWLVEDN